jgi:hypothetical protein
MKSTSPIYASFGIALFTLCLMVAPSFVQAETAATEAATPVASARSPEKKIRLGIVPTSAQFSAKGGTPEAGEGLRAALAKYIAGPKAETVLLTGTLPANIDAEAKEKQCDFVLYSSVSQKAASRGGFGFMKGASTASRFIPMMGAARGVGGAIAMASAQTVISSMSSATSQVKAKAEVTLAYKLVKSGVDTPLLSDSLKAKASEDSQDVISPLLQQAATAVLAQVTK